MDASLIICVMTSFALGIVLARQYYVRRVRDAYRRGQDELFVRRTQADERLVVLQNQIEERDAAIEAQTQHIAELNERLARIAELESDLARLKTDKENLESHSADLDRMLRESDRLCSGIVEVTTDLNVNDPQLQARLQELRQASRESSTRLARLRPAVVRKRREESATRETLAQLATLLEKALLTSRAALSGLNPSMERPAPIETSESTAQKTHNPGELS